MFSRTLHNKYTEIFGEIERRYEAALHNCFHQIDAILSHVPVEWELDKSYLKTRLSNLFEPEWRKQSLDHFSFIIQRKNGL